MLAVRRGAGEEDAVGRFLEFARELGLDITRDTLDTIAREGLLAVLYEYEAEEFIGALELFIEREARRKSGIESITVRIERHGGHGEHGDLVAYIPVAIGGRVRSVEVYRLDFMKLFALRVASNLDEFNSALESIPGEIAEEALRAFHDLEEMRELREVALRGAGRAHKLVMVTFDLQGKVLKMPAIVPKGMTQEELRRAVIDTINGFERAGVSWAEGDLFKALRRSHGVKVLPAQDEWGVEVG